MVVEITPLSLSFFAAFPLFYSRLLSLDVSVVHKKVEKEEEVCRINCARE